MPEELICPWCKKEVVLTSYFDGEYIEIECENEDCPVQPVGRSRDSEKEAINAWNQKK